jgi:predicted aspartyl protease
METSAMGKVLVTATIENLSDLNLADKGVIPRDEIRRVEIHDALVDTGATGLCMPKRLIDRLGLQRSQTRRVRTSAGPRTAQLYHGVLLTISGRNCLSDVTEIPDDCPVLIGQIPLEAMDFVVDPTAQRLIGNPAHGGEQVIEIY